MLSSEPGTPFGKKGGAWTQNTILNFYFIYCTYFLFFNKSDTSFLQIKNMSKIPNHILF